MSNEDVQPEPEETVTVEDPNAAFYADNPEMKELFNNAEQGQFSNTLLTMWERQIADEMEGFSNRATIDMYDAFLNSWSHMIKYNEVPKVREQLLRFTRDTADAFDAGFEYATKEDSRTREEIMAANENDWLDNKHIYWEIMARFTALMNVWGNIWEYANDRNKHIIHVAFQIAVARAVGQGGLIEQARNLKDFQATPEESTALGERIGALIRESLGMVSVPEAGDE